jgi:hypothetical protein
VNLVRDREIAREAPHLASPKEHEGAEVGAFAFALFPFVSIRFEDDDEDEDELWWLTALGGPPPGP